MLEDTKHHDPERWSDRQRERGRDGGGVRLSLLMRNVLTSESAHTGGLKQWRRY